MARPYWKPTRSTPIRRATDSWDSSRSPAPPDSSPSAGPAPADTSCVSPSNEIRRRSVMDRVPQGVRKMLGMAYAISPAPARRRPFWLTLACALVWVVGAALLVLLLPLLGGGGVGFAFAPGRRLAAPGRF